MYIYLHIYFHIFALNINKITCGKPKNARFKYYLGA